MSIHSFASIDDVLGPSANRFFSAGYRRSEHALSKVRLRSRNDEGPCFEGAVTLSYPRDWSVKTLTMDVTPHVSTVDMLVLAMQRIEAHLTRCLAIEPSDLATVRIVDIALHAGTKPQEELESLPATALLRRRETKADQPAVAVSTYECRVGRMRAVCRVEHPNGSPKPGPYDVGDLPIASLSCDRDTFGARYKRQGHTLSDVRFDFSKWTAHAHATLTEEDTHTPVRTAANFIDVFVTSAQLAQGLLYALDALTREETSTLWMIRTHLSEAKIDPCHVANRVEASIVSSQIIEMGGRCWRNADIVGALGDKLAKVTFAHALPQRVPQGTSIG